VQVARDIEQLLTWAYRDELVKRVTSSAEGVWDHIRDVGQLGGVEIVGGGAQRYDIGTPHPDALRLEQGVALLPDATVDWEREAGSVLGELLALVDPRVENNAPAGSLEFLRKKFSASWPRRNGARVRVELEPPRDVILVRSLRTCALVTMHARMGTRPDWFPDIPKPEHVPSARGSNPKIVGECRGRNYYSTGAYCPLRWEPSPLAIAEARADYLAWWRGLDQLARSIRLEKFSALAPAAPEMPWHKTRNRTYGGFTESNRHIYGFP